MNTNYDQRLAEWEKNLLSYPDETSATVVFTLESGKTLRFYDVNPDSIGPSAEAKGVIGVEFADKGDRVIHVPFVSYWEIEWV